MLSCDKLGLAMCRLCSDWAVDHGCRVPVLSPVFIASNNLKQNWPKKWSPDHQRYLFGPCPPWGVDTSGEWSGCFVMLSLFLYSHWFELISLVAGGHISCVSSYNSHNVLITPNKIKAVCFFYFILLYFTSWLPTDNMISKPINSHKPCLPTFKWGNGILDEPSFQSEQINVL